MSRPKSSARLLSLLGAAVAALIALAPAASAQSPAPGYTQFAGCPTPTENSSLFYCFRSTVDGGNFKMGSKNVQLKNPVVLSGGLDENGENFTYNSKGGLLPAKQLVPGGLIGLTGLDWLVNFLSIEQLQVFAVTELAGQPGAPLHDPFHLPVKVRLVNPTLGSSCYVGSNSNPIDLNLTTGTTSPPAPNQPITGKFPELVTDEELIILKFVDGTFVDNSFSAPGASGCKLTLFGFLPISLNGLVNLQSGLPAAAGTNETVQHFDGELVERALVYP